MTIMSGKDHAESFLLVETGRVSAWMEDDILIAGFRANAKNPADFRLLHKAYPSDPYALMFRKDDPPFKALPAAGHQHPVADVRCPQARHQRAERQAEFVMARFVRKLWGNRGAVDRARHPVYCSQH